MTTPDDPGVLLIHPEPDPLAEHVVELLAAREAIAHLSTLRFEDEPLAIDEPPGPVVWHLQPPPPSPCRTLTHARHGGRRGSKAARKAQKQARKANRRRK